MLKRSLRIKVMAVMFSVAFFVGYSSVDAYTYNGGTSSVDKLAEDENELVVTGGAKITSTGNVNPNKVKTTITTVIVPAHNKYGDIYVFQAGCHHINSLIFGLPVKPSSSDIAAFKEWISSGTTDYGHVVQSVPNSEFTYYISDEHIGTYCMGTEEDIRRYVGRNCDVDIVLNSDGTIQDVYLISSSGKKASLLTGIELTSPGTDPAFGGHRIYTYIPESTKTETKTENLGESSITVQNNSSLIGKVSIQTSKDIKVSGNSVMTATQSITGGTITSDGDIIAEANYSAPSGKSTITAASVVSKGALTAAKDIKAMTGSISGTVIQATGGNIIANNTIKTTGKVKGNALNVGVINASSASITGNQSISGVFTISGQAKLNGGVTLGGKKITGLSIGTLSTTSTDAVNGKQLYTAIQSSGKTYMAGSDISISSANAISVSKAGKVASGNMGIMTGDAVYQETGKIDSIFKTHNTSIISNNSKLDNLTTSIESLRKTLGTINTSVSDAISGLPGSLANFANEDLTDLSDTGRNTLKAYIKNEVKKQMTSSNKTASYAMEALVSKDTSAIDNVIASKANTSDLTALGSKVDSKADIADVSLLGDRINAKADLSYVNDELAKKADQSVVTVIDGDVGKNTSAITKNTELIQSNNEAISGLKDSKADVSGSNIDVSAWSGKLGTGTVAKDDTGLVTGSSVASALDKKAGIGYVAIGLGVMESGLEQMGQQVSKDVSRVGAGASALMGLHPTGDKFEFATAYGHYKNSNNTALGVFYKPSPNSTVSVAGTIGDGDAMLSAGVSIKLGLNKEVKKVITPNEFGAMKSAVDSQDEKLDQIERTLQQLMAR